MIVYDYIFIINHKFVHFLDIAQILDRVSSFKTYMYNTLNKEIKYHARYYFILVFWVFTFFG